MTRVVRVLLAALPALALTSCSRTAPPTAQAASPAPVTTTASGKREIRITGIVEAVHSSKVLVPQIFGPGGPMTLTRLIRNGSQVKEGDVIATFDATNQIDQARDAQAKYDDLGHQVEQKRAQNRADAEKRTVDLKQAEGDLAKSQLELKKGITLPEIDLKKTEVKVEIAKKHLESIKKSHAARERADVAALRILELQRERQKVALERTLANIQRLEIKSKQAGMVAIQNVWRANTEGKPQEGDQLYPRQALASIFDPTEMAVRCSVGEPDGVALRSGAKATIYLDAYPDISLTGRVKFVSPVAASALFSPIKSFNALIKLDKIDPRVMPDLSAAVVVDPDSAPAETDGGSK